PVMRASLEANSGAISGSIDPAGIQTEITATKDNIVFLSTYADVDGNFVIAGVEPGIYEVTITPDPESEFDPIVVSDVEVTLENTTEIGTIELDTDS
ncbi:MAG: carbohydrate-binding protein, partial [Flavobacteriaceae bacterium]|nr:carbohydrate-binding protein [Flavobacteriaceae bacterium]